MREQRRARAAEFDYIIVGAGTAGCILAARLSEDPAVRVLLVEAGGSDGRVLTRIPLLSFIAGAGAKRNWQFTTEPIPALNGREQEWNQGRIVGGSGSINGMIYLRGSPAEYDAWERSGCTGWSYEKVLPYFKKLESDRRGTGLWHGGAGPINIRPSELDLPICAVFLEAAAASGYRTYDDLNAGVREGFGRLDCNINRGTRVSSARAYLRPARRRRNLVLITQASVLRVVIDKGRARGVEVLRNGRREMFTAGQEVTLCAGTLNTPLVLMHSGIGPADHLADVGIKTLIDAREVGSNLRNHPVYMQRVRCTQAITGYSYLSPGGVARALYRYALRRTGPIAESVSAVGGFLRSDASLDLADTLIVMIPFLMRGANATKPRWFDVLPTEQGYVVAVSLGRPLSTGRIRLRSSIPGDKPRIFPNYFVDGRDISALVRSVRAVRRLIQTPPIADCLDRRDPGGDLSDEAGAIESSIRARAGSLSHPSGTCRMGSDPLAVVDAELRVNGVSGLRVADNSILPQALNAGTHAAALMIGEKASDLIRSGS
jgi:choline dehydrogenase